jgi:uncharacterized membrane protein
MTNIEKRQAHLELQINLLTEQKTSKLIKLIEELRRDLPMIEDRFDPESVIAALDEYLERKEPNSKGGEDKI